MHNLPFIKMHGCGNDYVFVDGFETDLPRDPAKLAIKVADRNFGVGSDGLILLVPVADDTADVEMRMFNADGSEGDMCGNGVRCVALWMARQQRVSEMCRVRTKSRLVTATVSPLSADSNSGTVSVDMGAPVIESADDTTECLTDISLPGQSESTPQIEFTRVSMGNPHAVIFNQELSDRNVKLLGAAIERHSTFPNGTNVEWVNIVSPTELQVRVWERGSGETLACGSGACAVGVAAVLRGFCRRGEPIGISLPGGRLEICWKPGGHVLLTGPATVSFVGTWHGDVA